ncbi:MAG: nucleotidyltransferase domain-containing protein, partial [Actinomycetota bacterium]
MIGTALRTPEGPNVDVSARIVRTLKEYTKVNEVVLCGSRATGQARADSDYDVLVVVPLLQIPFRLSRLNAAASDLESALGVRVSINPLPSFRLRRPGRTLLVWKALAEGTILAGTLPPVPPIRGLEPVAARSYAMSGIRYLVEHLPPDLPVGEPLPERVRSDVGKALLHAAQLRLLDRGEYASTIESAITKLGASDAAEFARLMLTVDRLGTWRRAFQLLTMWLGRRDVQPRSRLADAQYLALSILNGHRLHPSVLFAPASVRVRL